MFRTVEYDNGNDKKNDYPVKGLMSVSISLTVCKWIYKLVVKLKGKTPDGEIWVPGKKTIHIFDNNMKQIYLWTSIYIKAKIYLETIFTTFIKENQTVNVKLKQCHIELYFL